MFRVPCEVSLLGESDCDASRRQAFQEVTINDRTSRRLQFDRFSLKAAGNLRIFPVEQICPDGFNLHVGVTIQNLRHNRTTTRPRSGHTSSRAIGLRIQQVPMEPFLSQATCHCGHVQRLNSSRGMPVKDVAFDAGQSLVADQQTSIGLDAMVGLRKSDLHERRLCIKGDQFRNQCPGLLGSKLRHTSRHIRPIFCTFVQNCFQPCFIQLVASAVERRRNASFVTHFRDAAGKDVIHGFRDTTH